MEENGLLEDMNFEAELEGFYSGTSSGTVNLQPMSISGNIETPPADAAGEPGKAAGGASGAAAAVGAAATVAASALMGGKFGQANSVMSEVVGNAVSAAVPTSLQPVKEKASSFLSRAQPWREFLLPLSIPSAKDSCSRITANLYCFQTNYAILFAVYLVMTIILQPSALIAVVVTIVAWVLFLKKNDDPEWKPELGGVALGPIQRWLLLAAVTALVLLVMAGSTIFNSALMYVFFACVHGVVHDPSGKELPGVASPTSEVPL
eukprot:TRINITY_DN23663_c0_g1_i1.p1 TRINITY_DN23663_c0_g1~~TRINITY_DN23663_c0_g1_i1.p1  ORF type:complete len:298 (-),score=60.13 TRINITY_DN23663_c0_g1_i1:76-864(-)